MARQTLTENVHSLGHKKSLSVRQKLAVGAEEAKTGSNTIQQEIDDTTQKNSADFSVNW